MKQLCLLVIIPAALSFALALCLACGDNGVSSIEEYTSIGEDIFSGPRLSFRDTLFVFGYTPQNSTVSHTFWLYSTGTETVEIHRVIPG
ncbi:MAG: hypothetical protein JXA92_00795 [candidate division Zixibacteria bacterium]|nr:hypothetical protein [candidate division Zixibacteria bacterium]